MTSAFAAGGPQLTIVLASMLAIFAAPSLAADRPNIILMMGDDHGWEETGYNGHPHVQTPVLDEMAATGLRLDRFYAAHPSCSPTRVSFLTGRHPNRMGTFAPGWSIRPEEITIAQLLGSTGYHCGHFGKWHVGTVKQGSPTNPGAMGFDEWLSHDNFFELNPSLSRNGGPPQVFPGESSEILIRETIAFLNGAVEQQKPFLAVVWFGSPHEPYSGLPKDLSLYDDLPGRYTKQVRLTSNETGQPTKRPQGEVLRERYAEITAMDRAIGTLRDHLEATGLKQNTLLFYCGDNGTSPEAALGEPHRGVKNTVYEGGLLVPGVIEWPAQIPKPTVSRMRASTSDLLPTLCSLLGLTPPDRPLDGIDISPAFGGASGPRPQPLCFWKLDSRSLDEFVTGTWIEPHWQTGTTPLVKLSGGKPTRDFRNNRYAGLPANFTGGSRAIISDNQKLVIHDRRNGSAAVELFNLSTDPGETRNLATEDPTTAERLQGSLADWQRGVMKSLSGADYAE